MAVLVIGDLRSGVADAYEHPAPHGHRAQAVLIADRGGRGSGFDVHNSATDAPRRAEHADRGGGVVTGRLSPMAA